MKLLLVILLLLPLGLRAQTAKTSLPDKIFTAAEQPPSFPGGEAKLNEFIKENLQYTPKAKARNIHGVVETQFIVDTDGSIINPVVKKKLGYGLDKEAIRLINSFPKFIPAQQNGRPVAFRYNLPIKF